MSPVASATEQVPEPNIGDSQAGLVNLNLLNNLNVCPDVTVVLGLGNVLGILGVGTTHPSAAGDTVVCSVVDRVTSAG